MLTYFLQVNLCWLMFYGLYWALLSRETFFKLNRFYLIISLLCGLIVPFATEYMSQMEEVVAMPIVQISQPMAQSIEAFQENIEVNVVKTAETWNLWEILRGCYVVGVLWVLMRFLIGLMKIWKLYQRGFKEKNNDFTLVHCEGLQTPFSFFKWIFIDKTLYDAAVLGQILEHEKAHVHQKHSFDIVGIEILRGLFLISPLVHLYARSLRNVHEYLADAAVLQNTEKKQYGRLLISQSANTSGLIIANHFNFSQLKKRIIMMSRNRSERKALVKYILILPVFMLLVSFLVKPDNRAISATKNISDDLILRVNDLATSIGQASDTAKKKIPQPVLSINGKRGWVSVEEMQQFDKLILYNYVNINNEFSESIDAKTGEITGFDLEVVRKNGDKEIRYFASSRTGLFTKEIFDLVRNAKDGDSFHFKNINFKMNVEPYLSWVLGELYVRSIDKNKLKRWDNLPVSLKIWARDRNNKLLKISNQGNIRLGDFKRIQEVHFVREDFDYAGTALGDATYSLTRITNNGQTKQVSEGKVEFESHSRKFSQKAQQMIQAAQIGDEYHFTNIRFKDVKKNETVDVDAVKYFIIK